LHRKAGLALAAAVDDGNPDDQTPGQQADQHEDNPGGRPQAGDAVSVVGDTWFTGEESPQMRLRASGKDHDQGCCHRNGSPSKTAIRAHLRPLGTTWNCTEHSLLTGISLSLVARGLEPELPPTAKYSRNGDKKGETAHGGFPFSKTRSAERVPTRAASAGIGVVDGEALLLKGVFEVDVRPVKVRNAHLVDD